MTEVLAPPVERMELENGLVGNPVAANPEKDQTSKVPEGDEIEYCLFCSWRVNPPKTFCGGEASQRPNLSVWEPEDKLVLWVPGVTAIVAVLCSLAYLAAPERLELLAPPENLIQALSGGFFATVGIIVFLPLGALVWYLGCPVAYTRKILHVFLTLIVPFSSLRIREDGISLARAMYLSIVWSSLSLTFFQSIIYLQPVRRYLCPFRVAYAAIDRPEDRPFTNLWAQLQSTGTTIINIPMLEWIFAQNKPLLIWIPFMSLGLGDGLAEPVGKLFGKHKYETSALCTTKKFTRSWEGSACVFLASLLACCIASPDLSWVQFVLIVLTVPIANTLAEAKAPHTMDNHMMLGVTWLLLWFILSVLPTE